MSKLKTKDEWQLQSNIIHNSEFEILQNPISAHDKVDILHKKCGNILSSSLNNHIKRYCKFCSNKNKKTKDEWQILSNEIHNNEFEILEDVKNGKTKIEILHKKCGRIINMTMNNHINHQNSCWLCSKFSKKDNNYWKRKIFEIWGTEYTIFDNITNVHDKIEIRHNICGKSCLKNMDSFIHGKRGCEECNKNFPKNDINYWQGKIDSLNGTNEYLILESPKNVNTLINVKHIRCGRIYKTTPRIIKQGCGCNICNKSKGSLKVMKFLEDNNIKFENEVTFHKCKDIRNLRFDYYLPDYNICIEFDGIQHFESVPYYNGTDGLITQQRRDNIKNDFCIKNNIKLIRIKYTEINNINKILCQQLKNKPKQN